jgi:predicted aconitase with swiveling domain
MINRSVEQVTAIGCIIAEVPMVDSVNPDAIEAIKDGDLVEVNADEGIITVTSA